MNGNDIIALGLGLQTPWAVVGQTLDTDTEVAPFVRTVFSLFKVKSLPVVRLPVSPSAASRHRLRPVFFSLIVNGAGPCCTSPDIV